MHVPASVRTLRSGGVLAQPIGDFDHMLLFGGQGLAKWHIELLMAFLAGQFDEQFPASVVGKLSR